MFAMVIGFPLVSYLYLKAGFNVRKNALDQLSTEEPFHKKQLDILIPAGFDTIGKVAEQVIVLHKVDDIALNHMFKFAKYIPGRTDFHIYTVFNEEQIIPKAKLDSMGINYLQLNDEEIREVFNDHYNLLIKNMKVRKYYGNSDENYKLLYKHTVILLPIKKREKLELKRKTRINE